MNKVIYRVFFTNTEIKYYDVSLYPELDYKSFVMVCSLFGPEFTIRKL